MRYTKRAMTRWGRNLERLREIRGVSKVKFAELLGVTPQQLSNLYHTVHNPQVRTLQQLADRLGVDVAELFRPTAEEESKSADALVASEIAPIPRREPNEQQVRLAVINVLQDIIVSVAEAYREEADAGRQATGTGGHKPPRRFHHRDDGG